MSRPGTRYVDLFAGAGGATVGAWMAGAEPIAAVDKNPVALQTHQRNLPGESIQHDLAIVRPSILPPIRVDWLHGSPPCQGFSQASGARDPDDNRNKLVWAFVDWVDAIRPKVVTMENVTGMKNITSTFIDQIEGAFRDIGYKPRTRTLNAANYGVPQTRRRVFVFGVRDDLPTPERWAPQPTHSKDGTTTLDGRHLPPWRTVRDAIGDIAFEFATVGGAVMTDQLNERHQIEGRRPYQYPDDPSNVIRAGTPPKIIPNHNPVTPSERARKKMQSYVPGQTYDSVTERRLAGDKPAFTVAANHTQMIIGKDVSEQPSCTVTSRGRLRERGHHESISDDDIRRLTVREAARLQSFPDWFVFEGTKTRQYYQVGNAVPPRLMQHIADHIIRNIIDNPDASRPVPSHDRERGQDNYW